MAAAAAARLTPLTTRLVVEWNPKNPNAATVLQYLLQANLDLRNSNLSWLNLTMFDLRKICVREQKTNVLYRWICKLRSFLNRDSTVLYTAHCTVLPQPWFTPFFWRSLLPFWQNFEFNKTFFFCKFCEFIEISLPFLIWCRIVSLYQIIDLGTKM